MKKNICILFAFFIFTISFGQKTGTLPAGKDTAFDSGSRIENAALAAMKPEDLKALGLIWGFLKYYHPAIGAGKYNWDYELFRIIPKLATAKTLPERDKVLISWINSLGAFRAGKAGKTPQSKIKMQPDLEWITGSGFSNELATALLRVKNAKREGRQFYVGANKDAGNPEFLNENPYPEMKYSDSGYRLLALYRYWNAIQYFFPYKYLIEEDWKKVLAEFVPKFINAPDELAYKLVVLEIIARIHDTHANVWNLPALSKYKGVNFSAVRLSFAGDKAVVTGFYNDGLGKETGLKKGDVVSHVNDKPVGYLIKERLKYTPASNYPTQLRDIAANLLRSNDSVLNISYVRKGVLEYKALRLYPQSRITPDKASQPKDSCFRFISPKIGYLYPGTIKNSYIPKIMKEAEHTSGLIIDLRCYPSDFIIFSLGGYLKPEKTPFAKFSRADLNNPGQFVIGDKVENGGTESSTYKGRIVILVNETTQSNAEYTAMALQTAPNVTVIGSTTAGADGNVSSLTLPGNINTSISGLGVYYPDGKETQRVGIIPDIEIRPTVEGIRDGKDEVLDKAIEVINAN